MLASGCRKHVSHARSNVPRSPLDARVKEASPGVFYLLCNDIKSYVCGREPVVNIVR